MIQKEEEYVVVSGKNLYYEILNPSLLNEDNPLIVFLHEGLGSCVQWKNFPAQVCETLNYPGLVYERFGHGKSEVKEVDENGKILFDEALVYLPELLSKLQISNKLILIGHSDGGSIALIFASEFQEKLLGLVTIADHVIISEISVKGILKAVVNYEEGLLKKFLLKYHGEKADYVFYKWSKRWLSDEGKKWNIEDRLQLIKCPVLVIQGKDDQYGAVEQVVSKLIGISGTIETLFIENCGHAPHLESSELVLSRIERFIIGL